MMVSLRGPMEKIVEDEVFLQEAWGRKRLGKAHYWHGWVINIKFTVHIEVYNDLCIVEDDQSPVAVVQVSDREHVALLVLLYFVCFDVVPSNF